MSVYLHLFHGRADVAQEMNDWGEDGPVIGPLEYIHVTYMSDVRFEAEYNVFQRFFPEVATQHRLFSERHNQTPDSSAIEHHLSRHADMLEYNGMFYGDWSVSTSPTG